MDEKLFNEAVEFLNKNKIPGIKDEQQLYFYSHFKQATQGKCNTKQPSFFDFVGKAKWNSWSSLGDMSKEEAINNYINKLSELQPNWKDIANSKTTTTTTTTTTTNNNDIEKSTNEESIFESSDEESSKGRSMGPVMSRFSIAPEEDLLTKPHEKEDIVYWSSCDNYEKVKEIITEGKESINSKDSENKTALIWSCDRGNLEISQLLLESGNNIEINSQDDEGMTALHYASMGGFIDIVEQLLKHGALSNIKDNNNQIALDLVDPLEVNLLNLLKST